MASGLGSLEPTPLESIFASANDGAEDNPEAASGAGGGGTAPPQLQFPCALRPAASPTGIDLQLRLLQLQIGAPSETQASSSSSSSSSSGGGSGSGNGSPSLVLRRRAAPPPRLHRQQGPVTALLGMLDKAAGLLAARLLFPDAALPVVRLLAAAHCASAAIQVSSLLLSPSARAARHRLRMRSAAPLIDAAACGARQLGGVLQRYGEPAFVLLALAALWARVHPSSQQIGECIAALIPVLAGYNQTARRCVRQRLSGDAAEELWRKQHKWAARRTAGLLQDLSGSPPLAGAVSAWEALNIQIGAMVGGAHFGSLAGMGSGGSSGGGGMQLWASVGLCSKRSRQEQRAALSVAPGHVAATPAGPVEDEPLVAGGASSAAESVSSEAPAEQVGAEAPHTDSQVGRSQQQTAALPAALEQPAAAGCADGGGSSSSSAVGAHGKRGSTWDSPSEVPCSPQPGWASLEAAGPAGEAAAAAAAADFMHPAHWATARQAAAAAAVAVAGGAADAAGPAHSTSSSSVAGSSGGSVHSFLLPGACYSSQTSSEAGELAAFAAGFAAGEACMEAADGVSAAVQQQQQQQAGAALTAAALPAAGQPAPVAEAAAGDAAAAAADAAAVGGTAAEGEHTEEEVLPLYGRGDHLLQSARSLTLAERLQLVLRAGELLYLFAPFLLLGCFMLLLASQLEAAAAQRRRKQRQQAEAQQQSPAAAAAAAPAAVQAADAVARQQEGGEDEDTAAAASPAAQRLKTAAWRLLLRACKRAGAATVKWAQWSSTREDVFPVEFCRVMSELHDRAPTHTMAESRRIVEAALGAPLESLFLSFEQRPLASGSIAQVHRATMLVDGQPQVVAVKVRHPGVTLRIWQDFQLLRPLAALTGRIRTLRSLNLSDSVAQFSHTMTAQADLRVEAAHLHRFYNNFKAVGSSVRVPRPLPGLSTEAVLVETFEPGRSVAEFIRAPHPHNTQIVSLGLDCFLKQLLEDNFVHTDLHPGNILVRTAQHGGSNGSSSNSGNNGDAGGGREDPSRVELVLLDFGLAEELTPAVRRHFISFLHMISRGDGRRAAEHLLQWSVNQRCPDPEAFTAALVEMFREKCDIHSEAGIDVDAVLKGVLHLARHHEVSIDSNYAALVVGVCVIVGFATSLDRRVNLMDAATPVFLYHALTGRVSGRLYM